MELFLEVQLHQILIRILYAKGVQTSVWAVVKYLIAIAPAFTLKTLKPALCNRGCYRVYNYEELLNWPQNLPQKVSITDR